MSYDSYTEVECEVIATTDSAVLIEYDDGETWVPKSCIDYGDDIEEGDNLVNIANWFIEKSM